MLSDDSSSESLGNESDVSEKRRRVTHESNGEQSDCESQASKHRRSSSPTSQDHQNSDAELIDQLIQDEEQVVSSQSGHTMDGAGNLSQPTQLSMSDALANQSMLDDDECPLYLKHAFEKTHASLRNQGVYKYRVPLKLVEDEHRLLTMNPEHEITMDSASKCFRLEPSGSLKSYVQPHEGYYLCYMSRCNSMSLPEHIINVLYFYRELLSHLKTNGITNFAIPLVNQDLSKSANKKDKSVVGLTETIVGGESMFDGLPESETGLISIVQVLNDRDNQRNCEHIQDREPFTIRVAFTGAMYDVRDATDTSGETSMKQELFCVVIITPNAAFNLPLYVKEFFQAPPRNPSAKEHWSELNMWYKQIQMYEVNHNCGLFSDPSKYDNDMGGKGGVYSVLSMLNLPYRFARVIKEQVREGQVISNLRIIGLPDMSYNKDGTMNQYEKYMHRYITEQAELHNTFLYHLKVYCGASEAEQADMRFELPSPGGWPLKHVTGEDDCDAYLRFGLFKFPIILNFMDPKFVERMTSDSFKMNLGGLPFSVEKKMRDFKTYDPKSSGSGMISDSQMLLETTLMTPLHVMKKYFAENSQPEDDFRDDKLIKWYEAMRKHIDTKVSAGEMTATEAMAQVKTHMDSCMEQHRCMLDADGYGSHHLAQCRHVTKSMGDTKLATVSLEALLQHRLTENAPQAIKHDAYLSTSYALMHQWYDYNHDARLNATNLEATLEVMLCSLLWVLGSHHHTIVPFFQGMLIIANRGHNEMLIDKGYYMDWRKPNSSGAGCIQDRLNKMLEELCLLFNIMRGKDNKLVFINLNRNTDVALEQESCVVTVTTGGVPEVISRPSPEFKYMPLLMLEVRGTASLAVIIWLVFRRDPAARNFITTTIDPKNSNERKVAKKEQVVHPCVSGMCTNQKKGTDEPKTITCVTHVCDPGAPSYKPIEEHSMELNQVKCDVNDGRASMPERERLLLILKSIFFSHTFAKVDVALLHMSGAFPYRINFVTSSALDWFYMLLKEHLFCVFNPHMIENFGRVRVSISVCCFFA